MPAKSLIRSGAAQELPSQSAPASKQASRGAFEARPIKDKWAVVVGISRFKDPSIPTLKYPAKDARDFARFLVEKGNFAQDHVLVLSDEGASRDNIIDAIGDRWLPSRVQEDDLVVIFASTHGSPKEMDVKARDNFLIAYDTDPNRLFTTRIRFADLAPVIQKRTGCDRIVLFLDACNSGSAGVGSKALIRSNNFDVDALAGEGQIVTDAGKDQNGNC